MRSSEPIVVIGAGLGGLSAALHLAGAGREVVVLEQSGAPGGRAGTFTERGYTFDTGPTVLTMPSLLADALGAVGEDLDDWLTLRPLHPAYRARFADGSSIDVHSDTEAMAAEISRVCGPSAVAGYRAFVEYTGRLWNLQRDRFIQANLDSPLSLLTPDLARLAALGGFGRLAPRIARYFTDERLQRIFSFQSLYAGVSPQRALALYAVIAYLDTMAGVYFPDGGMYAVPQALASAASKHGVEFRYGERVEHVEIGADGVRSVHTASGTRIAASAVIVNADAVAAYRSFLRAAPQPRSSRKARFAPSCVVLHAGSSAAYPDGAHHTISFGRAWDQTFEEIIDRGVPMSDPSLLVSNPSRTDPTLAPEGRHTYYALFPAPNLVHNRIDWDSTAADYRDQMVDWLERRGWAGFGSSIEVERLVTPADWARLGLPAGTPFAAAHTFSQTGPFRHPTGHPSVKGLFFCGSHVQPGVGVPMVLISGRLVAQRLLAQ